MQTLFLVLALFSANVANAALCSRTLTFSDGAVLTASQLNSEFNAITNCANSLSDANITTSAAIDPSKISSSIAGSGISRNGTTGALSVNVDDSTIEISSGDLQLKDAGITIGKLGDSAIASDGITNLGLLVSVSGNELTISLKQADGSTAPSATQPAKIGFRSSTATSGAYVVRSVTAATTLTISSGSTLGTTSGVAQYLYVYAIDNAGTVVLGIAGNNVFPEGSIASSTAEGGAGGADDGQTMYSTASQSSKAIRLIGRIFITEATAGTWASSPTEVTVVPFPKDKMFWMVNATITTSGNNPSLGTGDVVSPTGITATNLSLTNDTSSVALPAKITCSSTNTPSGTTCSSGDEEVGVSFVIPQAPVTVKACAQFSQYISLTGASSQIQANFFLVETPNNAQTVTQTGFGKGDTETFETIEQTFAHNICSIFTFTTAGQKSLRVFYLQDTSATVNANRFNLGGVNTGSQATSPMNFTVFPISQ